MQGFAQASKSHSFRYAMLHGYCSAIEDGREEALDEEVADVAKLAAEHAPLVHRLLVMATQARLDCCGAASTLQAHRKVLRAAESATPADREALIRVPLITRDGRRRLMWQTAGHEVDRLRLAAQHVVCSTVKHTGLSAPQHAPQPLMQDNCTGASSSRRCHRTWRPCKQKQAPATF